jgi:hypothetical protein
MHQRQPAIGVEGLRAAACALLLLCGPFALIALATAVDMFPLPYDLWLVDQRLPKLFRLHMVSAGLALLLVPSAIACHGLDVHKLLGRSAALLVVAGGLTAVPVALASEASLPSRAGFTTQAVVWIALVLAAVHAIRRGARVRHMWLMLAVAAVASAAMWLRLASWAAVQAGLPFEVVYPLAAWLSWMLPLGAVGLVARHRGRAAARL